MIRDIDTQRLRTELSIGVQRRRGELMLKK